MWIITAAGFYSIVRKPSDPAGKLTIRARVKQDLVNLKGYLPQLSPIIESDDSDYKYRAFATPAELASAVSEMINAIDYPNFKDKIGDSGSHYRTSIYSQVWGELMRLEHLDEN